MPCAGCSNRLLAAWTQLSKRRWFCWLWTADSGTADSGTAGIRTVDSGTADDGPCLVRYLPLKESVSDSDLGSIWAAVP